LADARVALEQRRGVQIRLAVLVDDRRPLLFDDPTRLRRPIQRLARQPQRGRGGATI
jgi:hypothetical protein